MPCIINWNDDAYRFLSARPIACIRKHLYGPNLNRASVEAGGIRDHGDGTYEASYITSVAGEVQLVVGLHGNAAKTVFKAACLPATIALGMCEVQLGMAEITAGQPGQLRFWTADRWEPA